MKGTGQKLQSFQTREHEPRRRRNSEEIKAGQGVTPFEGAQDQKGKGYKRTESSVQGAAGLGKDNSMYGSTRTS